MCWMIISIYLCSVSALNSLSFSVLIYEMGIIIVLTSDLSLREGQGTAYTQSPGSVPGTQSVLHKCFDRWDCAISFGLWVEASLG